MYDKNKHAVVDRFVKRIREKISLLKPFEGTEVKILPNAPLYDENPSVQITFESSSLYAEFSFWSNLTIFVTGFDKRQDEILFCDNRPIHNEDEVDIYIDKVLNLVITGDASTI